MIKKFINNVLPSLAVLTLFMAAYTGLILLQVSKYVN